MIFEKWMKEFVLTSFFLDQEAFAFESFKEFVGTPHFNHRR